MQLVAVGHDTPESSALAGPGGMAGVGWVAQLLPFQLSASCPLPTAAQLAVAVHDTCVRTPALGAALQVLPFHCSATFEPTARHAVADAQDTPSRAPLP